MGLVYNNNKLIISLGESDYKTIIVELDNSSSISLFSNVTPNTYKFLTYESNNKHVCYY